MGADRREAEIAGERRSEILPLPPPLQVVHREAVDQHDDPARCLRNRGPEIVPGERQRGAVATQAHGDGERVGAGREMVAEHAVERRQDCLARRRRLASREQRRELSEQAVDAVAEGPSHAANAAIDEAGHAAGARVLLARGRDHRRDHRVHGFDEVGEAGRRVDDQPAGAAQVRGKILVVGGHRRSRRGRPASERRPRRHPRSPSGQSHGHLSSRRHAHRRRSHR